MSNCTKPLVSDLIDKAWQCIVSFGRAKKTTYMYKCYLSGHILFLDSFSFGLF